jgi:hypothetical protein
MINQLRILIREIIAGVTHPHNDKDKKSDDSENQENPDSEEQQNQEVS